MHVLQLIATYRDGRLTLTTSSGALYTILDLDDTDAVETLELMDAGHRIGTWPFATLQNLDRVLAREHWRRWSAWTNGDDGLRAVVRMEVLEDESDHL